VRNLLHGVNPTTTLVAKSGVRVDVDGTRGISGVKSAPKPTAPALPPYNSARNDFATSVNNAVTRGKLRAQKSSSLVAYKLKIP